MRKSLLKTPHSAPSSAPVPARVRAAVEEGGDETEHLAARVRLLEGFVARGEISDCTQLALQWLGEVFGIAQSICLIRPETEQALFVVGSYGLPSADATGYSIS